MKRHIFYLTLILLVPLTLYLLSLQTVLPIPADDEHAGITEVAGCLECHADDKGYPKKKTHPPKDQCFNCHKPAEKQSAAKG